MYSSRVFSRHSIFLPLWFAVLMVPLMGLSQAPALYVDISRFYDTRVNEPFVQMYVAVAGQSITFTDISDGRYQAKVEISLLLRRIEPNGDTSNVDSDKYVLELPTDRLLPDTTVESRGQANLLNIHQVRLTPATYLLEVQAIDLHAVSPIKSLAVNEFVLEGLPDNTFAFSDVKWVAGEMPTRNGRRIAGRDDLIPLVTNSAFFNEDTLKFYQEIYNADEIFGEKGRFWIRSVIYQNDNRLFTTETPAAAKQVGQVPLNAHKQAMYIGSLSSNTYRLQVELLNERNQPVKVYRKKFFVYNSRLDMDFEQSVSLSNPETDMFNQYDEEKLDYYIQTLMYASTDQERRFSKVLETYQQKKNFLYSHFDKRKNEQAGQNVQAMWNGHLWNLAYANEHFDGAGLEGWQTDRGRVWMVYGAPNDIERYPSESSLLPYEIWRYNRISSQNNVVFIFYDPDLALGHYPLLHSTKYGEINNPRWRDQLFSRTSGDTPQTLDYETQGGRELDTKLIIDD